MAAHVVVPGVVLYLLGLSAVLLRWNAVRYRKKGLPPGTMGWPIFGEIKEFLQLGPNFMKNKFARYGSFFKTHILGCPTIVSTNPEINRYILMKESKGLIPGYPQSMLDILGRSNIGAVHGSTHKYLRAALVSLMSPPMIRDQVLPKIDQVLRSHMAFLLGLKQIAGIESGPMSEEVKPDLVKLVLGTISIPINLPGTNYHRGLQLIDRMITILNSRYETVSTTSMMTVKYLHDHPEALRQLREEHLEIRGRERAEDPIEWEDLKSMQFTRAVIYETLRLATVVNGVFRKTTQDMELNGFTIPKGWRIYVYIREMNHDPHQYPDLLSFIPWRWLVLPGRLWVTEISTFLHYSVTRYRWEEVGENKIVKFPRVAAPNGLHIRVENLNKLD
ncbi:hypothetical protein CRG98_024271 [Punica granatum]|uniref:Cytochrome P450 85A1-like n=1 Tax=Punica granatum TaxID=22663 RepID=A0A2I0JGH9_PUNGR|nr:hypothetical protein CRG98_024271 [Punica granatum]